jgi:hypothetical protein
MLYIVRDTKKRSCLREKKRLARILMYLLTVQIEGTAEATLRKSTLLFTEHTEVNYRSFHSVKRAIWGYFSFLHKVEEGQGLSHIRLLTDSLLLFAFRVL